MITDFFIKRPVFTIACTIILCIVGAQSLMKLTTRQYPKSDLAVVKITTPYVGADANLIRGFITTPIERAVASADGIEYIESESTAGISTVSAHLRLNFDVNAALTQIQAKVAQVRSELPRESESPRIEVETTDNRFASIYLSFYSSTISRPEITDYLTRVVQPKLLSLAGVQRADILGARTYALRIWLDPSKLAEHNLTPNDIRTVIQNGNYQAVLGKTEGNLMSVSLTTNGDLKNVEGFQELLLKRGNLRLKDVADVTVGAENYDQDVRFDGKPATFMGVWPLPNANTLDVIKRVREALPVIESNLPEGMKFGIPYDATRFIENSLHEVFFTLGETVIIVMVVIFLFIGSVRSVLIPVVTIPLSLLGGGVFIYVLGFSLNLLTLLAIVLAVGLVVDDAIVMLEHIDKKVKDGMKPIAAAMSSARELLSPIVAMTITLGTVYSPIAFQGGLTGVLFREFALTLTCTILMSGVIALFLSPMMASRILRSEPSNFENKISALMHRLEERYRRFLMGIFGYRKLLLTLGVGFVITVPALYMFSLKELAPKEDRGIIFNIVQTSPNNTLANTQFFTSQLVDIYRSFPEYRTSFQLIFPNSGFSGLLTKIDKERSVHDMQDEMWQKVGKIPGIKVIVATPPPLPGGSRFPVEMVVSSTDGPEKLLDVSNKLVAAAFASKIFMFAFSDLYIDLPTNKFVLDRDIINQIGLAPSDVFSELSLITADNYVNRFDYLGRSYKVIPQAHLDYRSTVDDLLNVYVRSGDDIVPVSALVKEIERTAEPRSLNRFNQLNAVKIQGAIPPGITIDQGLKVLEDEAAKILPKGYFVDYVGESRQLRQEQNTLVYTLIVAIILIYLVLAAQFESFKSPFIILGGSVPLALFGSLLVTFSGGTSINIYSQVGLVTLVGIVAKNGILIVEFANHLREQGASRFEACIEGAVSRLRPILMTSVATIAGHTPLIFAHGAGAEARNSIGLVLVIGMLIGTIFSLIYVPLLYSRAE